MLTQDQQIKLVQGAKQKNPNISFEETKALLDRANSLNSGTLPDIPQKSTFQKIASYAGPVMGTAGVITGAPLGIAPLTGGLMAGAGEIINQVANPGPIRSKYSFGQKYSPEDLPGARQEAVDSMDKVGKATAYGTIGGQVLQEVGKLPAINKGLENIKNYVGNITSQPTISGKIRQILPSENLIKTGSTLANDSAESSKIQTNQEQLLDTVIKKAEDTADPQAIAGLKRLLTANVDSETRKLVMNSSTDKLKELILSNNQLKNNLPADMSEALVKRRGYGQISSWTNFLQTLGGNKDASGNAKAAKLLYGSLNDQLKNVAGIAEGDSIVQMGMKLRKVELALLGLTVGKSALSGAAKVVGAVVGTH